MSTSKKTIKILVINGPNLNLLGIREPGIYGAKTLAQINAQLAKIAKSSSIEIDFFQSNHEGELIEKTQHAAKKYNFLIINPAAYTHTSVGWRDAILAVKLPFVEVHLSNIFTREEFRHKSFFSDIAIGVISGLGAIGYELALNYAIKHVLEKE